MSSNSTVLISILVPVYKVGRYIQRCATSLFEQSYSDSIEYIFVDDCSPDDSIKKLREVLQNYSQRSAFVKIISHEVNKGLSEARNTALLNATGKYIMHVDSDDYIELDMVEILLKKALSEDADMIICDYNSAFQEKKRQMDVEFRGDKIQYLSSLLTRKNPVNIWGRVIKRDLLLRHEIFSIPRLNHGEDYAVVPRIVFYADHILKVDKPLYNYVRYNMDSYTHCVNEKAVDDTIMANQILVSFFSKTNLAKRLPLSESLAVNAITLFYSSDKGLFNKIAGTCSNLNVWTLNISIIHKLTLLVAQLRMYNILNAIVKVHNLLRTI